METFETNSETCFSNRSYAWTDLESIYYGRGRGMCTNISSHSKVQNIPPVQVMNEMNIILKSHELSWNRLVLIPEVSLWSLVGLAYS